MDKHQLTDFKKPYFSLIIPIYSSGIDIRPCLHSCIHQSFEDIEILLIDDCGNPDSVKIAEEMAQKDSRISIFYNSENCGTFQARLTGMQRARGEYILFVDDDDYISLDTTKILFDTVSDEKPDIIVFNIDGCTWDPILTAIPQEQKELIAKLYNASICARAYSRAIIQQTLQTLDQYFPPIPKLILHEDALISFIFLYFCERYKVITDILYFYCENTGSISRIQDKNKETTIERERMRQRFQVKKLFAYIDLLPPKQDGGYFEDYKNRAINNLEAVLEIQKRNRILFYYATKKGCFSYLKACYLANQYLPSWKNYAKAIIYCLSLGHIKR